MHKIRMKALSSVHSCLHMSCTEVQYVGDFLGQMLQVASTYFLLNKHNKSQACLKVQQANFSHKHNSLCKVISSWSSLVCLLQNQTMWHLMKEQEKILLIDVGKRSKFWAMCSATQRVVMLTLSPCSHLISALTNMVLECTSTLISRSNTVFCKLLGATDLRIMQSLKPDRWPQQLTKNKPGKRELSPLSREGWGLRARFFCVNNQQKTSA